MLMLGDMLATARRSAADFQRLVEMADPALAQELRSAAERSGDSLAGLARAAVADFSRFADEEAWAQLTRIVRDDEDPGTACLMAMVRWRVAQGLARALHLG
jgi:hypothetical protein